MRRRMGKGQNPSWLRKKHSQRGFTFLEVMIGVAILSIALVSLLRLVVLGISNVDYDKTIPLATLYAREIMNEGFTVTGDARNAEGRGEDLYDLFTWKRTITPTVFNRISQLKVVIEWQEGEEKRNATFTEFIFEP